MKGPKRSGRSEERSASTATVRVFVAGLPPAPAEEAAVDALPEPDAARCEGAFGEQAASSADRPGRPNEGEGRRTELQTACRASRDESTSGSAPPMQTDEQFRAALERLRAYRVDDHTRRPAAEFRLTGLTADADRALARGVGAKA